MNKSKAVLSIALIMLLGGQWLLHPYVWIVEVHPTPAYAGHSTHGYSSSTATPLPHSCCEQNDGTMSSHDGELCCGACPALPGAMADFDSYTPYLFFRVVEPQGKSLVFLTSLWHPPTL